jgi:ATP-dependent Lon protease
MKAQSMNPIIFFDELDKVSTSSRGEEIIGLLTHITDGVQNERFHDRYFGELELDLSKSLIIFSYNDESLINPILKDRMITIRVKGYDVKDKCAIARDYLLPSILTQYNLKPNDVTICDDALLKLIQRVADEEGVRNLKRGLESIISWINMHRYLPGKKQFEFPLQITTEHVSDYVNVDKTRSSSYVSTMYT